MLTSAGFKRLRTADYLPIIQEQARELFGEDADLSELTPLGKFIYLQAQQRAEDNELAEQVWNSRVVETSEGASLEVNVKRALITRRAWKKASGQVILDLSENVTIPTGHLFSNHVGVLYKTISSVQSIDAGNYSVQVEALDYGLIGNTEANSITTIVNPLPGLNSVTNPEAFTNGQNEETDEELRTRYYESLGAQGNRRLESLRARLPEEIEGLRSCLIIENDTNIEDVDGRPPHSFETIILGGDGQTIADKILTYKPFGIRAYGSESFISKDSQGTEHSIGFSFATPIQIFVTLQLKKSSNYPVDGDEQVKKQVLQYIGGTDGQTTYNGLGMSEDVILARLEARIFNVEGIEDVKASLSVDGGTFNEGNIEIGYTEVAETDTTKIEVSELV